MRVLVTWGSKRGGTEGIARILGEALQHDGFDVDLLPPNEAARATKFDAAIVGGALYANRWHHAARRFVSRQEGRLRRVPVWFFSSGPLDDSADRQTIPPTRQVQILMDRVGAQGHVTFGGRLAPDARGFPASAMARKHTGDWRHPDRIRAWASEIAGALPVARPGRSIAQPGRSPAVLFLHGLAGWTLCAATMGVLMATFNVGTALLLHALAAPLIFTAIARHYFRQPGARDPLPTALTFAALVILLDLGIVAGLVQHSPVMFRSFAGSWLAFLLIFLATWITGEVMSTQPWPKSPRHHA
jgi:menaquinone-dependent protoporphyrinogen oxidase